ncbi:DUF5004 domain-containing protein [Marinigracilibium pacificum]|uniref:DUF5004 domain-containing protein n=1 Tax=Marinigracilibium pacificum TaxID=2729599 RepID=A0A848J750_9BACT|nr:DUF5004 domain-containing protein [Marinigracilibium pacificum]NMM50264.1 DUF5004 domain-containing protein [Marinigracilibium pacificum]
MKNLIRRGPLGFLMFFCLVFGSCTEEEIIVRQQPQSNSPIVGEWTVTSITQEEVQTTYEDDVLVYENIITGYAYDLDYNMKFNSDATLEYWGVYSYSTTFSWGTYTNENIEFDQVGKWLHEGDRLAISDPEVVGVYQIDKITETELEIRLEQVKKGSSDGRVSEVHSIHEMKLIKK